MAKPVLPPRFKPLSAPTAIAAQKLAKTGIYRGSPRDRGYDAKWDRLSVAYRRTHPFCLLCEQAGKDTLTDLVDHIIPVVDRPGLKYQWSNLAPLCTNCHGVKGRLERTAREQNNIDILIQWVKIPSSRPYGF